MNKVVKFAKLDFLIAIPNFYNLVIPAFTLMFMLGFLGTHDAPLIFFIAIHMDMIVSFPFGIGKPSNMDALYVTLNIDRTTVVRGRYLYSFAIIVLGFLISLALISVGLILESFFSFNLGAGTSSFTVVSPWVLLIHTPLVVLVQSISIPIYFKFTTRKAGGTSAALLVLMMVYLLVLNERRGIVPRFNDFMAHPLYVGRAILALLAALVVVVYISYRLSLRFYMKREF